MKAKVILKTLLLAALVLPHPLARAALPMDCALFRTQAELTYEQLGLKKARQAWKFRRDKTRELAEYVVRMEQEAAAALTPGEKALIKLHQAGQRELFDAMFERVRLKLEQLRERYNAAGMGDSNQTACRLSYEFFDHVCQASCERAQLPAGVNELRRQHEVLMKKREDVRQNIARNTREIELIESRGSPYPMSLQRILKETQGFHDDFFTVQTELEQVQAILSAVESETNRIEAQNRRCELAPMCRGELAQRLDSPTDSLLPKITETPRVASCGSGLTRRWDKSKWESHIAYRGAPENKGLTFCYRNEATGITTKVCHELSLSDLVEGRLADATMLANGIEKEALSREQFVQQEFRLAGACLETIAAGSVSGRTMRDVAVAPVVGTPAPSLAEGRAAH